MSAPAIPAIAECTDPSLPFLAAAAAGSLEPESEDGPCAESHDSYLGRGSVLRRMVTDPPRPCFWPKVTPGNSPARMMSDRLKPGILPVTGQVHDMHASIRSILPETVMALLQGAYAGRVDEFLIVDCRFPHEYEHGHIPGARNIWTMERVVDAFLANPVVDMTNGARTVIVFHCEFSALRGPLQMRYLRELDNTIMVGSGVLIYPEVYLMQVSNPCRGPRRKKPFEKRMIFV